MMEYILCLEGPFPVPFEKAAKGNAKHVRLEHGREFWRSPGMEAFKSKQGCYIFATRAAKGFRPWYVGKAAKGFQKEVFTSHKLTKYNKALFKGAKGTPVIFFVMREGNACKLSAKVIGDMEKFLIQTALEKNPDLSNVQNTRNTPKWGIRGVVRGGKGKPRANAKMFRNMMGL